MNDTHTPARSAVVIGAGIVGASVALRLRRDGFDVTLVDRDQPGMACSFGNAGRIATGLIKPKSVPGLLRKVPGMLRDPKHPLKTTLGFVLANLGWFDAFRRAGDARRVETITDAMHALLRDADDAVGRMAAEVGAADVLRSDGVLYVYQDPALAEEARDDMQAAIARGMRAEAVSGDQIRDIDPAIPASVSGGYYKPAERFVRDSLELTEAVVHAFVTAGGQVLRDEVTALEPRPGRAPRVRCRTQALEADKVVLAAGAWSARLAAQAGVRLLVLAERGYHAMLPHTNLGLRTALHYGDRLVSMTPMTGGLRVTSGAEFTAPDAPPDWQRRDVVIRGAQALYPDLDTDGATRWVGSRPSTPDTLPVIGASGRCPDLLFATGHGTLGLTLAARTAELVADLACGRETDIDITPYLPDRFRR
jgi:D-amino-acid dehydrogenase